MTVVTFGVIWRDTWSSSVAAPYRAITRTTSRSERMPRTLHRGVGDDDRADAPCGQQADDFLKGPVGLRGEDLTALLGQNARNCHFVAPSSDGHVSGRRQGEKMPRPGRLDQDLNATLINPSD